MRLAVTSYHRHSFILQPTLIVCLQNLYDRREGEKGYLLIYISSESDANCALWDMVIDALTSASDTPCLSAFIAAAIRGRCVVFEPEIPIIRRGVGAEKDKGRTYHESLICGLINCTSSLKGDLQPPVEFCQTNRVCREGAE